MPRVPIEGGCLYHHLLGHGKPLVIIRGLSRSSRYWLGYDRLLAKHFQVIAPDNRGIGRSQCNVPWTLSVGDMADDIFKVLDHLKLESAHIMGISLGGMVALAMGLSKPERCRSLTVVNSSVAGEYRLRLKIPAIIKLAKSSSRPDLLNAALAELLVSPDLKSEVREKMKAKWLEIIAEEGFPYVTTLKQLLAAARFRVGAELRDLRVPTLVAYGSDDQFVPNVNSFMIHRRIPGARLLKLEGAGHEAMTDRPQELLMALSEHIAAAEGIAFVANDLKAAK